LLPPEPKRLFALETRCDGKDEDGDGHVDLLIPTGANACTTSVPGACGRGWLTCRDGRAFCETPAPAPEVADGVDNDCNGVVDDVPPARLRPRALVLGPEYIWRDAKYEIAAVTMALEQAGIPFDLQPPGSDWTVDEIGGAGHSLLVVPGYLESDALSNEMRRALETFASGGGVVLVMKPMPSSRKQFNALALAGLKSAMRSRQATQLRITGTGTALAAVNSPEEREVPLTADATRSPVDVWLLEPEPKTAALAEAYAGKSPLGIVATRRPVGRGAVYAWGHDLTTFDTGRCYMNCFDPGGDLLRLVLREAHREAAQGHVVLKHPMPGPMPSVLLLTHDVDARDAYTAGAWGEPGALQMAAMEKKNGARATYTFAADPPAGPLAPEIVEQLCRDGFCSIGASSVRRPTSFSKLPRGDCRETRQSYGPTASPTLCGEVRVSLELLAGMAGARPRLWRSPFLAMNSSLFDVLADSGVTVDSSFAVGDLMSNLPVETARSPKLQKLFHGRSLVEVPISGEDGMRTPTRDRVELQERNLAWFLNAWEYILLRNAENTSVTTLDVRPSRGADAPEGNIASKVRAVEHMIQLARAHGIALDTVAHFGDFWRARGKVAVDAEYDVVTGYTGRFIVGDEPIEDLTLEFGDGITFFECPACGRVEIHGKRIVFRDRLAAGTVAKFVARPRALPPASGGRVDAGAPELDAAAHP
jgi:hypothetical protein